MRHLKLFLFSFVFVAFALALTNAEAKRTSRDLVFEDDEKPAIADTKAAENKTVWVSIKTAVELERDGKKTTVLPTHEFQSGDRVRFKYTVNTDCYVYWVTKGTSGNFYMLFPHSLTGMNNLVKKNEICTIPVKGRFKFDDNPGKEKIVVFLSKNRIPELENAVKEAADSRGKVHDNADELNAVQANTDSKRKSRDLVFEEEEDEKSGIATSSQASSDDQSPLVAYYELVHR